MVRASAKNHDSVAVVVDPSRYDWVLESVKDGGFTLADRRALAATAFRHTATYDVAVASYLGNVIAPDGNPFPGWVGATWERHATLRYGENPHQAAALYASGAPGLAVAEQLSGKEMSYNNYVDADAAWRAAHDHGDAPCVAVIKHANPCGIAIGADVAEAHRKAHATDPTSAFGGVIAVNGEVSVELAEQIAEIFTEVIVAPAYAEGASAVLAERRNLRVLRLPVAPPRGGAELRPVSGGLLLQQRDGLDAPGDDPTTWTLATGDPVDDDVLADLVFAWRACRSVKSNAILLATDGAAVGVGMGQVNRVDAARLAVARAGDRARGSVAASDAYFPFPDGLQVLLDAGVRAVVQPGRLGARPALGRGRGGCGRPDVLHGHAALRPLTRPEVAHLALAAAARRHVPIRCWRSPAPGPAAEFERKFDSPSPRGAVGERCVVGSSDAAAKLEHARGLLRRAEDRAVRDRPAPEAPSDGRATGARAARRRAAGPAAARGWVAAGHHGGRRGGPGGHVAAVGRARRGVRGRGVGGRRRASRSGAGRRRRGRDAAGSPGVGACSRAGADGGHVRVARRARRRRHRRRAPGARG